MDALFETSLRRKPVVLAATLVAVLGASPGYAVALTGTPATYTTDAHFDQGTSINVVHDPHDQLQLDDHTEAFNFIWVAASGRGTIVKIDTTTGTVLGEYQSAPDGRGRDPSRTTVDANGNVWAGNRAEAASGLGSAIHIGLAENAQCVDRNANGVIDTSSGLGDIKPWPNTGGADDNGGVSTAADECIVHYVRTSGTNVRTVAVDGANNVWIGGVSNRVHELYYGATGAPVAGTQFNLGCGGYGGLVDGNGVIWSASANNLLLRYDPATKTGMCLLVNFSYGLGIDNAGNVWNTQYSFDTVKKFAPDGTLLGTFPTGGASGDRGVAITPADDNVWVANSSGSDVSRLDNNGNPLAVIAVGNMPTGVSVDATGKVWVTNYSSNNAMRIDPATNTVDLTVALGDGANPYNYSDMTGSTVTAPPSEGTWTVIHDAEVPGLEWGTVSWHADQPGDSSIVVSAASSDDGVTFSPAETATNGGDLSIPNGRWIKVVVHFTRSTNSDSNGDGIFDSPILYDLTIAAFKPFLKGKMMGGGKIHGSDVTHGFTLHCDIKRGPNQLEVNWDRDNHCDHGRSCARDEHGGGDGHQGGADRFQMERLTKALCFDDPAIDPDAPKASFDTHRGQGTGRYNGKPGYSAQWTFTDAGEPGDHDFANIVIKGPSGNVVLDVSGELDRGNHQAVDLR